MRTLTGGWTKQSHCYDLLRPHVLFLLLSYLFETKIKDSARLAVSHWLYSFGDTESCKVLFYWLDNGQFFRTFSVASEYPDFLVFGSRFPVTRVGIVYSLTILQISFLSLQTIADCFSTALRLMHRTVFCSQQTLPAYSQSLLRHKLLNTSQSAATR